MLHFEWTHFCAATLRQLRDLLPRDVVARALPLVTLLAKVRVAPAEPLRDRAAKLALELDKVYAVSFARRVPQT